MPKMGFEVRLAEVEKGYTWPGTQLQHFAISAEKLKDYGLQRRKGVEGEHYSVWMLAVGEMGGQLTYFYGHTLGDAAKKAYEWKFGATEQKGA